jgi:branched-subunit amino acid aminotransferase/4-amino-4-deoxychorismate lyase
MKTCARAQLEVCVLRITVTRGVLQESAPPTVVISALPLPSFKTAEGGIRATVLWPRPQEELPPVSVKSTSYQRALLARQEAARRHADEGLYLGEGDTLVEGASSNLFFVKENRLLTAPDSLCLPGITRAEVLSLASEMSLAVEFSAVPCARLAQVSECFVTSSLQGLRPVVQIDGHRIGTGQPGPWYQRLVDAYLARTRAEQGP